MSPHTLTVTGVRYHRNGVTGDPFHVVTFTSPGECRGRRMIGIAFDGPGQCAVIDADAPHETWRGDRFEHDLRAAIDTADETGKAFQP